MVVEGEDLDSGEAVAVAVHALFLYLGVLSLLGLPAHLDLLVPALLVCLDLLVLLVLPVGPF